MRSINNLNRLLPVSNRLPILGIHLGLFFVLILGYKYFIVPIYGYTGFVFEPNGIKFILAVVFLFILSFITPSNQLKPSTLFLHITVVFVLIPMLVLFCMANKPWLYTLQVLTAYILVIFFVSVIKLKTLRLFSLRSNALLQILLLLSIAYIVLIFSMGGGRYFNLDFSKVYTFRSLAANNLPRIFGYISPIVGKILLPFSFLLALTSKKYLSALLSVGLSVLAFGLTTHKGTLFYPFFVAMVYMFLSRKSVIRSFSLAIFFMLVLAILDFSFLQTFENSFVGWFGSLAMRRAFIVPANLNYIYYDFFSRNDWVFWAKSSLTMGLVTYPYALDPSHLIGLEYFNSESLGANTGWLGSGYMHAGFFGILLYSVVIGIVFSYIDSMASKVEDRRLVIAGTLVPIFMLITSADLPTSFLTHGLLLNLALISFLKRKNLRQLKNKMEEPVGGERFFHAPSKNRHHWLVRWRCPN